MRQKLQYQQVIGLVWPSVIGMLGEAAIGLIDTKLVSSLGSVCLAGFGIGVSIYWFGFATLLGFIRSIKICTAHAVGEGKPEKSMAYAILGATLVGIVALLTALGLQYSDIFLQPFGINPDTMEQAKQFLAIRAWGLPAICVAIALAEHRQGLGEMRKPAMIQLAGNTLNATLAYGLIHGCWNLPACGIQSIGWAYVASETCQCVIYTLWFLHTVYRQRQQPNNQILHFGHALQELCHLGLPSALHFSCEYLAFMSFTMILGSLPQQHVAAHQVVISIKRIAFLPGIALGEAICILVGQALGGGQLTKADRVVGAGVRLAMGFMVSCGALFALCRESIANFFSNDPSMVQLISKLLVIVAFFQVVDSINITMRGALRGAKDVRAVALLSNIILWATLPTAAYGLGKIAGFGVLGGWAGFVLEGVLTAGIFSWRWYNGSWRRQYTTQPTFACKSVRSRKIPMCP